MSDLSRFGALSSTGKRFQVTVKIAKRWHSVPMSQRTPDPPHGAGSAIGPRFLTLADVAETLATSVAQVRALVQAGELRYIQIGGRQQYRIEVVELERYIERMYAESEARSRVRVRPGTDDRPA
jgi:excisionase family DNA binding protein